MTLTDQIKTFLGVEPTDQDDVDQTVIREAILHTMASAARSNGRLDVAELSSIAGHYRRLTGETIEASEISALVDDNAQSDFDLVRFLQASRAHLRPKDKKLIIEATYHVAVSDGEVQKSEEKTLGFIAMALGLTEGEFQTMTDHLETSSTD
jgi:tellurite resistance protein